MNPELLSSLAGIGLSLLFSYIPGAADWYAARDSIQKRLIMLGLLLVVTAVTFGLACANLAPESISITCDRPGAIALIQAFIAAAIANQATYMLSPKRAVKVLPAPNGINATKSRKS